VLIGVIGFPILFDTQPRPIPVDIPIEIPDRNKAKPLSAPAPRSAAPAAAAPPVASGAITAAPVASSQVARAEPPAAPSDLIPPPEKADPAKADSRAAAKPEPKSEAKPAQKHDDGAKALALLEGKPGAAQPAAAEGRFVVQVGAFADEKKARETRGRVEKAGLKTYTHVAETKDGKRIRVRVGPFPTRAEAEKAAEKIKGLDLQAAILTL
jgi:DedD protein